MQRGDPMLDKIPLPFDELPLRVQAGYRLLAQILIRAAADGRLPNQNESNKPVEEEHK